MHELFEEQAKLGSDATAVLFGDERLTYGELNAQANRLARHLRANGVETETLVGVCLRRSTEMIVAMLAVLKAGGAYLPLDPEYPAQRLAFMLEDTRAPILLTDRACAAALPLHRARVVWVDSEHRAISMQDASNLDTRVAPHNLVYVMYTSGSMGRPKGVMIEHRSVVRLVKETDYASFDPSHRFLQLSPISFDASTFEIWGPLLNGASLVVMEPGTPSLERLADTINRFGVTTLWLTAGLFNLTIEQRPDALAPLRQLLTGGDAASLAHFRKALEILPHCRLINGYGPTETTTFAVCFTVRSDDLSGSLVPIGFPISNTQVWILDREFHPVPKGQTGELFIGGPGVARGYLNRPELTAEKFVIPSWNGEPCGRLYRSGDLVRYREDGAIEFLGRADDQVKISGYRVEPGEIASALREHAAVRDAVVLPEETPNGQKRLIAYIVPGTKPAPAQSDLRAFLLRKLPQFMMPADFMVIDAIPLTNNGKVDRAALPQPQQQAVVKSGEEAAPSGGLEEAISAIWSEVLRAGTVGIHDNFFDLGGDSLKIIEVHSKLRRKLGKQIPVTDLFQYPTIAALVEHLNAGTAAKLVDDDVEARAQRQRKILAERARTAQSP